MSDLGRVAPAEGLGCSWDDGLFDQVRFEPEDRRLPLYWPGRSIPEQDARSLHSCPEDIGASIFVLNTLRMARERRGRWAPKAAPTCPSCGALVTVAGEHCRPCYNKARRKTPCTRCGVKGADPAEGLCFSCSARGLP